MPNFDSARQRTDINFTQLGRNFHELSAASFVAVYIADRGAFVLSAAKAWSEFSQIGAENLRVGQGQLDAFHADLTRVCEGKPETNQEVLAVARIQSTMLGWLERLQNSDERTRHIAEQIRIGRDSYQIYRIDSFARLSPKDADDAMGDFLQSRLRKPLLLVDYKVISRETIFPNAVDFKTLEKKYPPSKAEQQFDTAYLPKRTQKIPLSQLPPEPSHTITIRMPSVAAAQPTASPALPPHTIDFGQLKDSSAKLGLSLGAFAISSSVAMAKLFQLAWNGIAIEPTAMLQTPVIGGSLAVAALSLVSCGYYLFRQWNSLGPAPKPRAP